MNITSKIESKNYAASEHDVELLAADHLAGSAELKRVDGSYLRILVAALQARFNGVKGRKRASTEDLGNHSAYLAETHTRLYAHVLKGVTTPDVADDEALDADARRARAAVRNARGGFARSAASTLQQYIKAGGDVRVLDVTEVTKTQLRSWALAAAGPAPRSQMALAVLRRFEREATDLAADDPDSARTLVSDALERLQKILDDLAEPPATITQVIRSRPPHTRQPAPQGRAHA